MDLQKKLKFGLLALAIIMVASAVPANAQQLYRATFTLPFEAQWGNTLVEPGQYTITVEEALGQRLIRVHGATEIAVFAGLSSSAPQTDNGKLVFVSVDGVYTLKAFNAGALGQAFTFPVHKAKGDRAQQVTTTVGLGTN